ncbi:MAG: pyridoxal-phosphate dependent enzyme, partial [Pseudomonadales bacterium]
MIELVSSADVTSAQRRLRNRVLQTPVFERASFSADAGCEVHFKCENFQRTGSFKFRGATNALLQIDSTERQRGVV